jgi:hypothetical protein
VRAAIALARIFTGNEDAMTRTNAFFRAACIDVLRPSRRSLLRDPSADVVAHIESAIDTVFDSP